ncbi:MAG: aminopeptidase P family protein [Polyangiales bacterium]
MNAHTFRRRRAALAALCPTWTIVIPSSPRVQHVPGIDAPHRADANLRYLTGHAEPDATLGLRPGGEAILYVPEPDATHARWWGATSSLEDAAVRAGLDDVRPASKLSDELAEHLRVGEVIGHRLGVHPRLDAQVIDALHGLSSRRDGRALRPIHDPRGPLGGLRLRKDEEELACLRGAAALTVAAHRLLVETARPGDTELALAGRFEARCRAGGAVHMAYDTIVARGAHATCLHARPTPVPLADGDAVLVDAGAQLDAYACDLTRTWPIGRFDGPRAALYDVVLETQRAALDAVRPGTTLDAIHTLAKERLGEGLARLGVSGRVEQYFPHGTSHWLGLEVHDASAYDEGGAPVVLEPHMVFTVEPGIYIDADDEAAPPALRGFGVRIEDTVAVTANGVEVLTLAMPKDREALEALT